MNLLDKYSRLDKNGDKNGGYLVGKLSTFYLSQLIGEKIFFNSNSIEGKLKDLIVEVNSIRPMVVGARVKVGSEIKNLHYDSIDIKKVGRHYQLTCTKPIEFQPSRDNTLLLAADILDKRVVDIGSKKLVKAQEVKLALLSEGLFVIAIYTGLEGMLRRSGLFKQVKKLLKPFNREIPGKVILWNNVETLNLSKAGIKLSKSYSKLIDLHPSDAADILKEVDQQTQRTIFLAMDEEKAADILEEMETDAQLSVIESIPLEKAVDLLEKMPSEEVADILDEMEEEKAEELLIEMEQETSEEVRELMDYPENTVGSLMSPDFIAFSEHTTVEDTLLMLRKLKPEPENAYYLYIIDDMERLLATVSLRDIVVSEPQARLYEIMDSNIIYVNAYDKINSLADIVSKYNLLAVPVVDDNNMLLGIVSIADIVESIHKPKRII
jgi:magnesium transporter